jgi:lipid A ethanolaminephosphotransferase
MKLPELRGLLTPTSNRLCLLVAVWIVLTANGSFWKLFFQVNGGSAWLFTASVFTALVGLTLLLLRLLTPGRLLKPMLGVLLLLAASAGWFMDTYGVAMDSDMIRNALQTNAAEARDFVGWPLLWRQLWQAGLPIALLWRVKLPATGWLRAARDHAIGIVAGLALFFAAGLPMYSHYASFFRNQDVARYLIAPANVVVGSVTLVRKSLHTNVPFVQVGLDAKRVTVPGAKPLLVLVVVGETARAANFSLGGYARDTNPLLQQRDVYYFPHVISCGTSTAVSVPCMFSDLPRAEFNLSKADRRDTVLDILQRAGLAVNWIDNQSGCKKVCERVPHENAQGYHPDSCSNGECLDDALLHAIDAKLPGIDRDTVLLLHAMGSHGPTYHRRVTPEHEKFKPTCATERIEQCSDAEIVNAYDNSIAYTDFVLAGLIDRLAANADRIDAVLLYVSDHGESLGENGLYLHGQPYMIAPAVQKEVPMLLWFSKAAPRRLGLDLACVRNSLGHAASHDNFSHTLLGLGSVNTSVYRPVLDLLHPCKNAS